MSQLPYGPNTPAVRRFLVDFAGLSQSDRAEVVAAYNQCTTTSAWQLAERELGRVIVASGRESAQQALAGPLLQLVRNAPPHTNSEANEDADVELDEVAEAALAALLTLLAQDLLSIEQRRTLLEPFAGVLPAWRPET